MFDGTWFTVKRDDYVVDISEAQDESLCMLLVALGDSPFVVMGLPLYAGYYAVHDDMRDRIGFAPLAGSSKNEPIWGSNPTWDLGTTQD